MERKLFIFLALFSALIQAGENNVRVLTSDGQEISITQDQFNRFEMFQNMAEDLNVDQNLNMDENSDENLLKIPLPEMVTLQAFQDLLDLTELEEEQEIKTRLEQFQLTRILDIIKAGMFLEPNHELLQFELGGNNTTIDYLVDKFYSLQDVSSIKQLVNFLEQYPEIKLQFIEAFKKIKGEYWPKGAQLQDVLSVDWNRQGTHYFVKFRNGDGQLFDLNGNAQLFTVNGQQPHDRLKNVGLVYREIIDIKHPVTPTSTSINNIPNKQGIIYNLNIVSNGYE